MLPPPRLTDVRWVSLDSDHEGTLRELSSSTLFVATTRPAEAGRELRFDLRGPDGSRLGVGVARVLMVDTGGMGLSLLALGVDPALVARLSGVRPGPPPLPAALRPRDQAPTWPRQPPPIPREEPPSLPPAAPREGQPGEEEEADVEVQVEQLHFPTEGVVIGIDLGTTNTVVAHVKDGRPVVIPGRTGTPVTPSMITFDLDGSFHVGQRAVDRQVLYPERTVHGSKRLLGRTYRSDVAQDLQTHFAYPIGEADGQRFGVRLGQRVVSMDTIAARILDEVRTCAEAALGERVRAAVVTVPAYFSEAQREAVRRAAREANLVVHRIVNEPTAAAVAYGSKLKGRVRLVVWDFGGGTFDCSVVAVEDDEVQVLATGGDNFLGGTDFDDLIAAHLLAEFQAREGLIFDPTLQQIARLRQAAEVAKVLLSSEDEAAIEIVELTQEPRLDLRTTLTREKFTSITSGLVDRAVGIACDVLGRAGITPAQIDDVVLVGGSTRIFAVQDAVARLFGRRPSKRINAEEAVALGAALLGAELSAGPALRDILPMSIARALPGPRLDVVVPRHTRLPSETELVVAADLLGSVLLPLFQGDAESITDNEYLCTVVVEDRSLWDGGAVRILLSFDEHCVMAVEAVHEGTGRALPVRLDRGRQLLDVLRELGVPTRPDGSLPPPPVPAERMFRRLGRLFR